MWRQYARSTFVNSTDTYMTTEWPIVGITKFHPILENGHVPTLNAMWVKLPGGQYALEKLARNRAPCDGWTLYMSGNTLKMVCPATGESQVLCENVVPMTHVRDDVVPTETRTSVPVRIGTSSVFVLPGTKGSELLFAFSPKPVKVSASTGKPVGLWYMAPVYRVSPHSLYFPSVKLCLVVVGDDLVQYSNADSCVSHVSSLNPLVVRTTPSGTWKFFGPMTTVGPAALLRDFESVPPLSPARVVRRPGSVAYLPASFVLPKHLARKRWCTVIHIDTAGVVYSERDLDPSDDDDSDDDDSDDDDSDDDYSDDDDSDDDDSDDDDSDDGKDRLGIQAARALPRAHTIVALDHEFTMAERVVHYRLPCRLFQPEYTMSVYVGKHFDRQWQLIDVRCWMSCNLSTVNVSNMYCSNRRPDKVLVQHADRFKFREEAPLARLSVREITGPTPQHPYTMLTHGCKSMVVSHDRTLRTNWFDDEVLAHIPIPAPTIQVDMFRLVAT